MVGSPTAMSPAWLAVSCIWPDWNFRNISSNIKKSSQATLNYLLAILEQYQHGKNNSIAYRTARRLAHNAQIDLSNMISSLSTEPNPDPVLIRNAFRYLVYSHSQLSYISALGSHREQVSDPQILQLLSACQQTLTSALFAKKDIYYDLPQHKTLQFHTPKKLPLNWGGGSYTLIVQ